MGAAQPVERFFQCSLLGLLSSGYLAVAASGALDLPTIILTASALILRALMIGGWVRFRIAPAWVSALSIAYIGFYPLDYFFISHDFLTATVHFIFLLAALRILTAQNRRDYAFVKLIAFLELLAASILSANLSYFVFLVLFLGFGIATFAGAELQRSLARASHVARIPRGGFHLRLSALVLALAAAVVLLSSTLFFLLPRTAQAAFRHLVAQRYHLSGFSNEVTLGEIGELKLQSRTVMHVQVDQRPLAASLKWRGAALSEFDGRRWYNSGVSDELMRVGRAGQVRLSTDAPSSHRVITYQARLHALETNALFLPGQPEYLRTKLVHILRGRGDSFRAAAPNSGGIQYFGLSRDRRGPSGRTVVSTVLRDSERERNLTLPPIDNRVAAFARQMVPARLTPLQKATALEAHLRDAYGYTTELLPQAVPDPLAYFLFERRAGHCEYFASALAVMLRAVDVPARVVTGFQSGVYNDLTGWTLIRASDAHSWVEAWLDEYGWVTFDPTPPGAGASTSAWGRMALYIDAAETFWQEWVIQYDLERQIALASRVESPRTGDSWSPLALYDRLTDWASTNGKVIVVALSAVFAVALLVWFRRPMRLGTWAHRRGLRWIGGDSPAEATVFYQRMLHLVARRMNLEKPAWLTPREFALLVPEGPAGALVRDITAAYNDFRYGDRRAGNARLSALLSELENALAQPRP